MKMLNLFAAAGLAVAALGMSAPASAQHRGDNDRREHRDYRGHGNDRGYHGGWNNGRHHGWNRHNRHCRTVWYHHRRVTRCY